MRVNGICIVTDDVARLRSFYADALKAEAEGDDTFTAFHTDGAALVRDPDGNVVNFYASAPRPGD